MSVEQVEVSSLVGSRFQALGALALGILLKALLAEIC